MPFQLFCGSPYSVMIWKSDSFLRRVQDMKLKVIPDLFVHRVTREEIDIRFILQYSFHFVTYKLHKG